MLRERGETLDYEALLPPPLPAETNLFQIEELRGIRAAKDESSKDWPKLEALKKLGEMPKSLYHERPSLWGIRDGRPADMAAFHQWAKASGYLKLAEASPNPGLDLLRAMDEQQPLVKRLADAARTRPRGEFVPPLQEIERTEVLLDMDVARNVGLLEASRALYPRAVFAAHAGDADAAIDSMGALLAMAEASERKPSVITYLVGSNSRALMNDATWELMGARCCNAQQLTRAANLVASFEFGSALPLALRGEQAAVLQDSAIREWKTRHGDLLPRGYFDYGRAGCARYLTEGLLVANSQPHYAACRVVYVPWTELSMGNREPRSPLWSWVRGVGAALNGIVPKRFIGETHRRQALIAIRLEQWRLNHSSYPATLSELGNELPPDAMNGEPMRYRLEPDGGFMLWSVGENLVDNQGKRAGGHPRDCDLVWSYSPDP